MSRYNSININCPKCGSEHPFIVWQSINTVIDPQMKQAVEDMSAFLFECPVCGNKTLIDYSFLYHMQEEGIMIYHAASEEDSESMYKIFSGEEKDNSLDSLICGGYKFRIVGSYEELAEKAAIFDRGFDDRIIEIFKIHALAMYMEQRPGQEKTRLLFSSRDGKDYVRILKDGKPAGASEITESIYSALLDKYSGRLSEELRDNIYIDRTWALGLLGLTEP